MTFYTSATIITELLMLAMVLHVIHYSGFTKTQKTWFLLTFISIMVCAAAEYAVHCGVYDPAFAVPLTVLTVMQFSLAPILCVLFSGALGLQRLTKTAVVFFCVNFVIEAVSAPFGWIFYFNRDGYFRGKLFMIYEALYFFSLIYLIVNMYLVGKKFRHRDTRTILMIIAILAAGIFPMTVYKINITYVAVGVSASLCYIYYNDLIQQDIQAELVVNQKRVSAMQSHIIFSLSSLIENRDMETGEHVARTSAFVEKLARDAMADGVYSDIITEDFVQKMRTLAPMHDIGKIIVSDQILRKPGRLTAEEFAQMKQHASAGGAIVREVLEGVTDEESVSFASDIAGYHHERWDGTGYPEGLSKDAIPLSARIMAIADVYDALISERCYKKALPEEEAVQIIKDSAGTHFDPQLVDVFLRHRQDFS